MKLSHRIGWLIALATIPLLAIAASAADVTVVLDDGSVLKGTVAKQPAATQPVPPPATAPAQPPPIVVVPPVVPAPPVTPPVVTPPAVDPSIINVLPGQSWVAAVKKAKSGQTVRLAAGVWTEGLTDTAIRPNGVKIDGAGIGKTIVRVPKGSALVAWCWDGAWITGISFAADKPSDAGVSLWGCHTCLVERCEFSGFTFGLTAQQASGKGTVRRGQNLTVRTCYVHDNYNATKRSDGLSNDGSGMFASQQDALSVLKNVFDGNGWHGTTAKGSERCHNLYVCGDCGQDAVIAGNVFARASSHGLQARTGGTVANNVFIDNPIAMSFGLVNGGGPLVPGGVSGSVAGNLVVGTRLLAGQPRGYAMEVSNAKDVRIEDNRFASDAPAVPNGPMVAAIKLDVCNVADGNPFKGKQIVIGRVVLAGNAATWPGGPLWQHPSVARANVTAQQAWVAVDVVAARAEAQARFDAALAAVKAQ